MRDALAGKRGRRFWTWAFSSLIAGLLAAPMWLPTLKAYTGGGRLEQTGLSEYTFSENMPFVQIFSKLFSGANSTNELVWGLPNIFCGILVVALVILFFMNKALDFDGPVIIEVFTPIELTAVPKQVSYKRQDGQMESKPLEFMNPPLSDEEMRENMLIPMFEEKLWPVNV